MAELFEYKQGNSPLLMSFPHDGMEIPSALRSSFNDVGLANKDCDWYISKPYAFIAEMDISFIRPFYSRYVVDLNRSPEGELLYPGKMETGICPLNSFDGEALYEEGKEPGHDDLKARIEQYWRPYHQHIISELERIKAIHGHAILWDAHSIKGEVPLLFDGCLPDLNFGTANGASCETHIIDKQVDIAKTDANYSVVLNERFKGGYITRHYGDPENHINAIQLEINQDNYLASLNPASIDEEKSKRLSSLLQELLSALIN